VGQDEADVVVAARKWFAECYDDVHLTFEYAGIDPEPVIHALEDFLK